MSLSRTENGSVAAAPAFALLFSLCLSIHFSSEAPFAVSAVGGVLFCTVWMLLGVRKITHNFLPVFFLILFLSFVFSSTSLFRMRSVPTMPDTIETEGQVLLDRDWGMQSAMLIKTRYGKIVAYVPRSQCLPAGSAVSLRGATFDFKRAERKGAFDEFLFWHAKGAQKKTVLLYLKSVAPSSGLYKWQALLRERIGDSLPPRMAGYLSALTIGVRTAELDELHRRAGTVHLLAVSGFHVAILAGLCSLFFRRGRARFFMISTVVWAYVLFAGLPVGGVRAALMIQICLFAALLGKPSSVFNGVSAAGLLMLLYNPWSYFDVGWRLSVLAALFLCAFSQAAKRQRLFLLFASPLLWFVTALQSAVAFRSVPVVGLLLNLIAVPLFAFLFPAILLLALPALTGLPLGTFFAGTGEYFLEAWEIFSELLVRLLPYSIGHSAWLFLFTAVIFSFAVMRASGFSRQRTVAALLILPFTLFFIL